MRDTVCLLKVHRVKFYGPGFWCCVRLTTSGSGRLHFTAPLRSDYTVVPSIRPLWHRRVTFFWEEASSDNEICATWPGYQCGNRFIVSGGMIWQCKLLLHWLVGCQEHAWSWNVNVSCDIIPWNDYGYLPMLVQITDGELIHGHETAAKSSKIPAMFQWWEALRRAT